MTIYQVLSLLFGSGVLISVFGYILKKIKDNKAETEAIKLGLQALLRNQLVESYNKYSEKGYAPIYARDNFENMWKYYHALGINGVMDDIHVKFLHLPTEPAEKEEDF